MAIKRVIVVAPGVYLGVGGAAAAIVAIDDSSVGPATLQASAGGTITDAAGAAATILSPTVHAASAGGTITDVGGAAASIPGVGDQYPGLDYTVGHITPRSSLTPSAGYFGTSSNGQVIQGLLLAGPISINHTGAIIRDCRFETGGACVQVFSGTVTIEDCTMDGDTVTDAGSAIMWGGFTIRRCEIFGYGETMAAFGNCTIEDNYIHSFQNFVPLGAHQDGIQMEEASNVTIRHNVILMDVPGANANIHTSANCSNILVEDNVLASNGGKDFTVSAGARYRNNKISVLLANYGTGTPDCVSGPCPHIWFNAGSPTELCGTVYYDSSPAHWNSPTAGDPVELTISPITYNDACSV